LQPDGGRDPQREADHRGQHQHPKRAEEGSLDARAIREPRGEGVQEVERQAARAFLEDVEEEHGEGGDPHQRRDQEESSEQPTHPVALPLPGPESLPDLHRPAHSYTSRNLRSTKMLMMFMISVRAKSVSPTAKIVWYSTVPKEPSPMLTWTM